jgi:hypothetical protein
MSNGNDLDKALADAAEKLKREAYLAGWRDAVAALNKAAAEIGEMPAHEAGGIGDITPSHAGSGNGPTVGSTPWYVHQAVKKKTGMTGSEVVSVVKESGHNVSEGSIRTTLVRLKAKRLIVSRHGKWFAS